MAASGSSSRGKALFREYPPQDCHTMRARSVHGSDGPISLTHDIQSHLSQRVQEDKDIERLKGAGSVGSISLVYHALLEECQSIVDASPLAGMIRFTGGFDD